MFKKLMFLVVAVFAFMASTCYADSLMSSNDGYIDLPIESFLTYGSSTSSAQPISASTAPGYELDNYLPSLVWADGETTPVLITFMIPGDYASGGEFRILADESSSTTPNKIDFAVYVNGDAATWDAAATDQTPVALAGTAGTPNLVTLIPATDFAGLQPNKYVTASFWRDNVADGTGDLEAYHVRFHYKRKLGR